ncbi:12S rRNA N4-methylcytidine (m4C) methyltransferase isoform X2 [Paramormyrops kingsleyae]
MYLPAFSQQVTALWRAALSLHKIKPAKKHGRVWLSHAIPTTGSFTQQDGTDGGSHTAETALHTPVMLKEVLRSLDLKPGQVFLDMTFGAGGHTLAILDAVPDVTVYALDRDPLAFEMARRLSAEHQGRVFPVLGCFSEVSNLLRQHGVQPGGLDAVLLDAGCSSMQLDSPERGFSLSKDGPLDMRMDGGRCPAVASAADVVNALDRQALVSILSTYGEERYAKKIASAIVAARDIYPITRTQQLGAVIAGAFSPSTLYARKDLLQRPAHVATKSFQALRIFVNDELHELHAALQAAEVFLRPGGRLCVLTFHSLEDRVAKRFLHGLDVAAPPRRNPRRPAREEEGEDERPSTGDARWANVQKKVIMPQQDEVRENPRGRSAKLRAAVKL